jgi:phosphoribosyl-ATP pyrophosphohydrolase
MKRIAAHGLRRDAGNLSREKLRKSQKVNAMVPDCSKQRDRVAKMACQAASVLHRKKDSRDDKGSQLYLLFMTSFTLTDLEVLVRERASAAPEESYTAKLLAHGPERAAKKLGEEAVEVVIAAMTGRRDELTKEAADVLYHLLVVLRGADIPLSDVMAELQRRTAQSGLAEKASRKI